MYSKNYCPFKVPDEEMRKNSIGSLAGTPIKLKKSLQVIIPKFKPISEPKSSDWLYSHDEDGQTYDSYKSSSYNKVDSKRNVIYIQPLEESINTEFIKQLQQFLSAYYFGVKVVVRKLINIKEIKIDERINEYTNNLQYNASQILKQLESKLPADAFCLIGVLMTDIYPRDEWNFVFGIASLKNRTGVFSFARYNENFYYNNVKTDEKVIIFRACRVAAHEIGHMFGLRHCIYFSCLMNGSNNFEENLSKPSQLCPCCLRKLQLNIGFEILSRYEQLAEFCSQQGFPWNQPDQEFYEEVVKEIKEAYGNNYSQNNEKTNDQESKQNEIQK